MLGQDHGVPQGVRSCDMSAGGFELLSDVHGDERLVLNDEER